MASPAGSESKTGLAGALIPPLARFLIRSVTRTVHLRTEGTEILHRLESEDKRAILAFFHGRQFLLIGHFSGGKMGIMSSLSRDGEIQARILSGLGFALVRGSASRGGARGLIGMKRLMDEGYHATFAVDGPRGPLHEVKPGAVYLAKKTGAPVIGLAASARPAHIFSRAWDRYLLPWPFARGAVVAGAPLYFDEDMREETLERDGAALREELLRLQERADALVGLAAGDR